jgi:hypothetical protein
LLARAIELFGYRDHGEPEREEATPIYFNYRQARIGMEKVAGGGSSATKEVVQVGTQVLVDVPVDTFGHWLAAVPQDCYITAHVSCSPALPALLERLDYRHLFIIRDPRAVLPSLLSFILDTRGLPKDHFLAPDLEPMAFEERLEFLLQGGIGPRSGLRVRGFAEVYRGMLAWRDQPGCRMIRFEELIGSRGGGTAEQQRASVEAIASHLGLNVDERIAAEIPGIYNPSAPTFRIGKIDSWKHSLPSSLVDRLMEYCGPLCKDASYDD